MNPSAGVASFIEGFSLARNPGLRRYTREAKLDGERIAWVDGTGTSLNDKILRPVSEPFQPTGGLKRLTGSLGVAVCKVSAVKPEHHVVEAPARVFHDQDAVKAAYKAGEFTDDVVVVVRFQGPKANGMPELHSLTPVLANLQAKGLRVALVTDGRMSGAEIRTRWLPFSRCLAAASRAVKRPVHS